MTLRGASSVVNSRFNTRFNLMNVKMMHLSRLSVYVRDREKTVELDIS